ncbi:MAG TPA: hypothetical protein VG165_03960 [Solirubrobacteraceae bacterium]|nr:hypothetical protein [Solirubrobacteraceae bacterium]
MAPSIASRARERARIEHVHADKITAREFLDHAARFLTDAGLDGLARDHGSCSCITPRSLRATPSCRRIGLRVTTGDRSHILRRETALNELDADTEELLERLDASRERRNEASYGVSFIARASVLDAEEATTELLDLARVFIGATGDAAI